MQQAPQDTETIGINYVSGSWAVGSFNKRIGKMFNDNGSTNEAVVIDPFNITNLFANDTIGGSSMFAKTKVRLAVNNLFDDHSILGVDPAATKTSVAAPGDVLNIMAARSVSLSFTVGFAPAKRP